MQHSISKIVSGGQTGVDRAALDVAICVGISHGGWCPSGRRAEDGRIPSRYVLHETDSADYAVRTERNVIQSDGTLILHSGEITGGTKLTMRLAAKHHRPYLCVDLQSEELDDAVHQASSWIIGSNIGVLNVAGPRESSADGIGLLAENFLMRVLETQTRNESARLNQ